ncbi:transposase family protein [Shewanella electrodiphila]|uniref:Transposase family protein n=1 Tax=Shewanella electrodiphila TaxID=934143 RepID=A0ABT0KN26_9GAMM|nr:transposase family protein [Shewanella electrodiphila]MCL1044936.1 transposase family protein [Shewanella electrodiphila]
MFGYTVGTEFNTQSGGIQQILAMTANSVILSGENSAETEVYLDRKVFEKNISEKRIEMRLPIAAPIELTKYQKEFASDKIKYMHAMQEVVEQGNKPTTRITYLKVIELVETLHPETMCSKHPGWKTLCKYWKRFVSSDYELEALACKKRDCRTRLSVATEAHLSAFINTAFSNSNSNIIKNYYRSYIRKAKKAAIENDEIKVVSQRTFRRRLGQLNEVSLKLNNPNLTQKERNRLLLSLQKKIKTHFALQRVELDRVCFNLCLIDDDTQVVTPSISLYLAIDVYTRAIISVVLDFGSENKIGVLNSLRNIFTSTDNLPFSGRPESIVLDNGPGYNNTLIKKLAESLSVNIVYCPSNHPEKKPFIESFNNNFRNSCLKGTHIETASGEFTIGLNSLVAKRTDKGASQTKPPKDVANLTVNDFKRLLNTYLVDYHNTPHPSTGKTPSELWKASLINTPRDHYSYDDVKKAFHVELFQDTSKLQPNGSVRCNKQVFESAELRELYGKLKEFGCNETPQVKVYFDHFDARQVTVTAMPYGSHKQIEVVARNIEVHDSPEPISFNELNKTANITESIDIEGVIPLNTGNVLKIEQFYPISKRRSPKRGPATPSYEDNNKAGLMTQARIQKSHKITSMQHVDVKSNPPPQEATRGAGLNENVRNVHETFEEDDVIHSSFDEFENKHGKDKW